MPILGRSTPVVSVDALPVVTTTLFPSGTPTPITVVHSSGKPVPVGAIAGGVVAGAVLAIAVVVAWAWWGKSIKRKQAKQLREAVGTSELEWHSSSHFYFLAGYKIEYPSQCRHTSTSSYLYIQTHVLARVIREKGQIRTQRKTHLERYTATPHFWWRSAA